MIPFSYCKINLLKLLLISNTHCSLIIFIDHSIMLIIENYVLFCRTVYRTNNLFCFNYTIMVTQFVIFWCTNFMTRNFIPFIWFYKVRMHEMIVVSMPPASERDHLGYFLLYSNFVWQTINLQSSYALFAWYKTLEYFKLNGKWLL